MTPRQQLYAGRLPRRLAQLFVGLWVYGTAMAMFIRSGLGLDPWDVFHYGVQTRWGVSFGTVVVVVGFGVLLLWIPLRQWPGLGTVANAVVIGVATDVTLALMSAPQHLAWRWSLLLGGIVLNGAAGAMYIGSQLGPGPRDGLMTGLARRTGLSLRVVRTALELTVLGVGWLLGGVVGLGTVLYALLIGPTVQMFLPLLTVRLTPPAAEGDMRRSAGRVSVAGPSSNSELRSSIVSVDSRVSKDLVETLQDGRQGFSDAAERLGDSDHAAWATTLRRFAEQRAQFATELEQLGADYGDDVHDDGSVAAKAHRGWMALKDALTGSKPDGVIDACVSGEDHAVSEYEDALGKDLSDGLRTVVQRQLGEIKAAREEIKGLQHATD